MDEQKTVQALKTVFDQWGTNVLRDRRRFESVLMDMLPGSSSSTERLVLRHALESNALTLLLRAPAFTADAAQRAVERLCQESRMVAEDAEFVIRCVIAARGGDPNVLSAAVPKPPVPVSPPVPVPPPAPVSPPQPPTSTLMAQAVPCNMLVYPGRFVSLFPISQVGNLRMLPDKLVFTSLKGQTEIAYCDIAEITMISKFKNFMIMMLLFAGSLFLVTPMIVSVGVKDMVTPLDIFTMVLTFLAKATFQSFGLVVFFVIVIWITWMVADAGIRIQSGGLYYSFTSKSQAQYIQVHTALRQRIYQNP